MDNNTAIVVIVIAIIAAVTITSVARAWVDRATSRDEADLARHNRTAPDGDDRG